MKSPKNSDSPVIEKPVEKPAEKPAEQPVEQPAAPAGKMPVEAWFEIKEVSGPLRAALMRARRWGANKMLTEAEFDGALAALRKAPAHKH